MKSESCVGPASNFHVQKRNKLHCTTLNRNHLEKMRDRLVAALLLVLAFLAPPGAVAQQDRALNHKGKIEAATWPIGFPGPQQKQLDLAGWMKLLGVPGLSVAIIDNYKIAWTAQYGLADVSRKMKVTPETLFQAGSVSKSVNAFGLMRLVESGRLSLDDDINNKLRSWKIPNSEFTANEKVTLRRVLSHTAGLNVPGFNGYAVNAPRPTLLQILNGEKPANTPAVRVEFLPGSKFSYSGGGVIVSQLLLSDVTGEPYDSWMQRNVFDPIGMRNSSFQNPLPRARTQSTATGYRGDGNEVEGRWLIYPEMAAAGLWTTPSDLANFAIGIMRALKGESRLMQRSTAEQMLTEQKNGSALGFFMNNAGQFGHNGSGEGFQTMLVCFRNGQGAVLMMNSDTGSYVAQRLLWAIATEYHWDYPVPNALGFPDVVFTLAMRDGAAATIATTRQVLAEKEQPLPHGPRVALNAAIGLIDAHRWDDALAMLDFQMELTPNSDAVYLARAHIYLGEGKWKEAMQATKHALEINPKNDDAKAYLEKLKAMAP